MQEALVSGDGSAKDILSTLQLIIDDNPNLLWLTLSTNLITFGEVPCISCSQFWVRRRGGWNVLLDDDEHG